MISPRQKVEFLADFPDDELEDDDGELVEFSGRNVSEAISEMLSALGYEVSAPEPVGELGWEFDMARDGCRFWIRLTKIEGFVLYTRDMTYRLWPDRKPYAEFLLALHSVLSSDPRFTQIRWFHRDLPSEGGNWFSEPVEA